MSNSKTKFSRGRVGQFCRIFSATEKSAQEIMAKAPWAISPLNQISGHTDEDTAIEETAFVAANKVRVTVADQNTREKLSFLLTRDEAKEIICLPEKERGRTIFSRDLHRIAIAVTLKP